MTFYLIARRFAPIPCPHHPRLLTSLESLLWSIFSVSFSTGCTRVKGNRARTESKQKKGGVLDNIAGKHPTFAF